MSARVLNPAMMTEMNRKLGSGRPAPNKAALARVRRDLFGPVDHVAARALAEREMQAQSLLDAERWGFDFHLELPRPHPRYDWEVVTAQDVVPEPYALRGMPYLRKYSPATPRKAERPADEKPTATTSTSTSSTSTVKVTTTATTTRIAEETTETSTAATLTAIGAAERTPPQEARVPEIGDATTPAELYDATAKRRRCLVEPSTPVLTSASRKQPTITDFMKSRKRGLNGTTKSMIEPPEKLARNTGQIRS